MQWLSLYSMVLFYLAAGINHFWHPRMYEKIIPSYIPFHGPMVAASGICEIVFALLLLPLQTRWIAAWLIIALLIAVFPANIQMAVDYSRRHYPYTWLAILRLPVQFLLIAWAWQFTRRP
ncbi:MAG TPA: MauE/DoxX family redox-associated membrane protein [Puia sp.]